MKKLYPLMERLKNSPYSINYLFRARMELLSECETQHNIIKILWKKDNVSGRMGGLEYYLLRAIKYAYKYLNRH
jgi:hypothetical protein